MVRAPRTAIAALGAVAGVLALATASLAGTAPALAVGNDEPIARDGTPDVASEAVAPAPTESCPTGHLAMTFDDGPDVHTGDVLDALAEHGVRATFFVEGAKVEDRPGLLRRVDREGHRVANHTYGHERLTEHPDEQIRSTIEAADHAIREAGVEPLPLLRPPFGATDARVRAVIESTGYRPLLWDLDSRDWESSAEQIVRRVLGDLAPGDVLLFHDGSSNTPETVRALPDVVDGARDRGYCFTVLDEHGDLAPLAFVDSGASVHTAAIERLADAGVTAGCHAEGPRFCTDESVTRAQMASFLARALDLPSAAPSGFEDVGAGAAHADAIDAVAGAGITAGCGDGSRYCPDEPVNRAQMATFLDRGLSLEDAEPADYVDVGRTATHAASIDALTAAGIAAGCDEQPPRYCPADPVRRDQMASFLDRGVLRR
ncbi:polysaccharide deacetylase family protein [Egicoccus halophilus]|uniref:Peptidoglycan/xylan/chitin deacetylase, PgdA/CDA1 family n=1 Tax=Egicoccus halophilus TaxID=1670830 RepID=A0A8J3A6A4_9ACTN|nr:polysaccharide deacetylase family protein [Egicoccus halophilus]GGI04437.1 hypothetical protein GCM10011354_09090 [Egicoccus halophilus]